MSSKIGLGYIGPRVRRIVKSAHFPVLVTSPVFKPWTSITVFFGGSANAFNALKVGLRLARQTGMPLDMCTQIERGTLADYKNIVSQHQLLDEVEAHLRQWHAFEGGRFEEHLYDVAHDSLVVVGAFGHGIIRDFVFGSKMEKIQATIMNNLLIVGPHYQATS
jgi:hypothetical protein